LWRKQLEIDTKRRATVNNSATNCTTPLIISSGWMNKIFQPGIYWLSTLGTHRAGRKSQASAPALNRARLLSRDYIYFYFGALACADKLAQFLLLGMPGAKAEKKAFCANYFYHYSSGFFQALDRFCSHQNKTLRCKFTRSKGKIRSVRRCESTLLLIYSNSFSILLLSHSAFY
jgi:hypothetical protein